MINQEFIESITLEGEEWRDVIGYEGLYMVSSFGRVISLKRSQIITIFNKAKKEITFLPKLLKFNKIKGYNKCKFYNSVMVYKDKKAKRIPVHRLVASAFIENPNSYTQIDLHIRLRKTYQQVKERFAYIRRQCLATVTSCSSYVSGVCTKSGSTRNFRIVNSQLRIRN